MLTFNILIITLFIKSYSLSIGKSQIESISEEIESYFTIPTNNSYNISFSKFLLLLLYVKKKLILRL